MNSQRILHRLAPWALPVLLLAVWQLSVSAGWLSTRILPAPVAVLEAGVSLVRSGEIWTHLAISGWRAALGFTIGGSRDNLEVSPNLWAGVGLVRGGAGTALVGDGPTVAARMQEYADLGIDTFIFSGYPHLEESYRVAELLFPHLDIEHPELPKSAGYVSPFGEMVANDILPKAASQS